jgi:hypothetical protein
VARATNGSTASASSEITPNFPASGVINGEHDGNDWGIPPFGGWADSTFATFPDNVDVDFHVLQSIGEIDVYTLKDGPNDNSVVTDTTTFVLYGITDFEVQTSSTGPGGLFTTVPDGNVVGNNLVKRKFIFGTPIPATNVRVLVHASADGAASRVVEIEAFSCSPVQVITVDDDFVQCPYAAFNNIPDAIAAASAGNFINVCAGTYPEAVLIDKPLTLLGAQAGQNANTRFAAFTTGIDGPKADPLVESVITAVATAPTSGANDTLHVKADNVTIDGFVVDGNNPALIQTGAVVLGGINTDSRRAIQTEDAAGAFFSANNVTVKNNVIQNFAQRGVELVNPLNTSPATSGSLITRNLVRNFGLDGIVLAFNACADITFNTVVTPDYPTEAGIWVQDFGNGSSPTSITIANNDVTVGQDNFGGIWVNLAYVPTLNINNNTVNAAAGVVGAGDFTFGIYLSSLRPSTTASLGDNIVGASGGQFSRGIALWNLTQTIPTTVTGGTVGNSLKGVSIHDNDPNFPGGTMNSVVNTSGMDISGNADGAFVDTAKAPTFTCNDFSGNPTGVYLSSAATGGLTANNNNISGNGIGLQNDGPAAVDAQSNWWGSVTGPTIASNPGGTGDTIVDPGSLVDYTPFAASPPTCAAAAAALRPIIQAGIKGEKARTEKAPSQSGLSQKRTKRSSIGKRDVVPTP